MKKIEFTVELGTEYSGVCECRAELGLMNGDDVVLINMAAPGCSNDRAVLTADDAEFLAVCLQRMATALRNSD